MKTIGVIGCGNMGAALIRGMIRGRMVSPQRIAVWDADPAKRRAIRRECGVRVASSNRQAAQCPVVLLAVKPQQMADVLGEICCGLHPGTLLVSVAAGITTRWIERQVCGPIPVVRVMPNTPALVGQGISAIAAGRLARASHLKAAQRIFRCVGEVVALPERLMDAVTAVSGSGPAYFFYLMEQMIEEGVRHGLPRQTARRLVLRTAAGAAALALSSAEEPSALRAKVTSKGGTTEAAFASFKKAGLGNILRRGIRAAVRRSKELAR